MQIEFLQQCDQLIIAHVTIHCEVVTQRIVEQNGILPHNCNLFVQLLHAKGV